MTAPRHLDYGILGPLLVTATGEPVDIGGPKQRAVLALLLIHANRPLTSDQMIDALWGEHPPSTALATLQSYISNLRRALEPERPARAEAKVLQKNGGGYQLAVEPDRVDALRFERLLAEATELVEAAPQRARTLLADALAEWRGPALADFRYAEFARAEIQRLEEMKITAMELRVGADLALGRSSELIAELEELVADHPWRERLWAHLMLALYRTGRQAEALRAYRRFEEIVADMGITPSESLRRLELDILNQDPALAPPVASPPPPSSKDGGGIIGRLPERVRFGSALDRARSGRGSVLLYDGEAGVGKTRLIEALEDDARAAGFRTAFARCVEVGGSPPFWPWIQLARQLGTERLQTAAGRYASYLTPLVPPDETTAPAPGPPLFRVAEGLAVALNSLGSERPLLLVIDDLYSADPDSLSVLTLLAAEIETIPIVIAASHRGTDRDPAPDLQATLTELMRLDWVDRATVPRLSFEEVAELVEHLAAQQVEESIVQAIFGRTDGNAFYTIELTKLLLSEASLNPTKALTAVPATVLEVMGRRLGRLSPQALDLVRVGAVYGRRFDLSVVSEAAGLELDDAVAAVDEILRAGLLVEGRRPGTYRFTHMIVVDSVTQTLGAMRRAQLHQQIADTLERRFGGDPTRWVEIAHHRTKAAPIAGTLGAIRSLARAGTYALASNALQLAEDLFEQRHELVLSSPPSQHRDAQEVASIFDLAKVWTWQEGYHSPRLRAGSERLWELTGISAGSMEFDTSRPIDSNDPILASMQARFSVEIVSGNIAAARDVADTLLDLSERHPDPMIVYAANQTANTVWVHAGRVCAALESVARSEAALEILDPRRSNSLMLPLGQQPARITHHSFAGWAHFLAGNQEQSDAELAASRELVADLGNPFVTAFAVTVEGLVRAMAQSPERVADAIAWGRDQDDAELFGLVEQWRRLQSAWAEGMLGQDPHAAAEVMRSELAWVARHGALIATSLYWRMVADLELRADSPALALDAIRRGIDRALGSGELFCYAELERLHSVALHRLGEPARAHKALRRAERSATRLGIVPVLRRLAASGEADLILAGD